MIVSARLTDRPTASMQQTSSFQGRTMAFVRNSSATGMTPPANSSALSVSDHEALNNVLLLVSGQDQFLVLPNNGFQPRLTHLDERSTGTEKIDKGTPIPFSAAAPLGGVTARQSLPVQETSGYKHQDPITPTTPFLEPYHYCHQSAKKRTRGDAQPACPTESPLTKKQLSMSQFYTVMPRTVCV